VVIPIKLELGASLGFIHKESVSMHGRTFLKEDSDFALFTANTDRAVYCDLLTVVA
jgi:hypothetical protein